jgi:probable F420-dependent oxidoreductase
MKYGVVTFSAGFGPERFERANALARRAEEAGFDSVWVSELYNRSATVPMATIAQATSRVEIGTNIAYGVGRSPLMWAAEAKDLDELSGGRVLLGLGNGTATMMEQWHGVSGESPAVRMEELVDLLRKLWRLDLGPVEHEGRFYTVKLRPTADTPPPYREHLPIYTAGVNPRMVESAGRVADGLVGHPMFTHKYIDEIVRPAPARGAAKRERDVPLLIGVLICSVDEDLDAARRRLAFAVGQYAASRVYDKLFALHGWTDAQQRIREAARARDADTVIAEVPDEALDLLGVACRPDELAEHVERHAVGYDHLALVPPPWGLTPEKNEAATEVLIEEMAGALVAAR